MRADVPLQLEADDVGIVARLAELAHEVRTPLYAIRGLTELLLTAEGELAPGLRRDLESIDASAAEALAVVARQLGAVRGSSLIPVRASELVAGVCAVMSPLARAGGVDLVAVAEADVELRTDPVLVAQVLRNLLLNALRHSGTTAIELVVDADTGGSVRFHVLDHGRGIAAADRERIFLPSAQLDGAGAEGLGLGLTLARRHARLLGGDLLLTSEPGEGARFTLELPGLT